MGSGVTSTLAPVNRVRGFRLLLAALLALLAPVSLAQGDWVTAAIAVLGAVLGVGAAVGVRNREAVHVESETGWRHVDPWMSPHADVWLVLMVLFVSVPVFLHTLPA